MGAVLYISPIHAYHEKKRLVDVQINTEPLKKAVENYKPAWLRNRPAPAPTEPAHPLPQAGPAVQEVNPEVFEPEFQSPFAVPPVVGSGLANIFALFQEIEERNNTN